MTYQYVPHRWTVLRRRQEFRVYVVQPGSFRSNDEAQVFASLVATLGKVNLFGGRIPFHGTPPEPFDLLVFPESYLPSARLLEFLATVTASKLKINGVVHVGVRDSERSDTHLFHRDSAVKFIDKVSSIAGVQASDSDEVKGAIKKFNADALINLAVAFCSDITGTIRMCIHPKCCASKFEREESNLWVQEVPFLTSITLQGTDSAIQPIHILPLICADLFEQPNDNGLRRPPEAMANGDLATNGLGFLIDAVDLISLPTYSTVAPSRTQWAGNFRRAVEVHAGGSNGSRLMHAVTVFANYAVFKQEVRSEAAGLSGAFVPFPVIPDFNQGHRMVQGEVFCRPPSFQRETVKRYLGATDDHGWIPWKEFSPRGFKCGREACTACNAGDCNVRVTWPAMGLWHFLGKDLSTDHRTSVLGFTLSAMPRFAKRWPARPIYGRPDVLVSCEPTPEQGLPDGTVAFKTFAGDGEV